MTKLPKPWRPMSSAPRDGSSVLLLEKYKGEYSVIVANWQFRDLSRNKGKRDAYWVGGGAIHTSGEDKFVGWHPVPPVPAREPWLKKGDRVISRKLISSDPEPVRGTVSLVFPRGPEYGGGFIYAVEPDGPPQAEPLYFAQYSLELESEAD